MALRDFALAFAILPMCFGGIPECVLKNTICSEIKSVGGFKVTHGCPEGSTIYITVNETLIGRLVGQTFEPSPEVLKMDNYSILMRDCKDFRVQCAYTNGHGHGDEKCFNFKMMECALKNIICSEIKSVGGFKIAHSCPEGSKIYIHINKTLIGRLVGQTFEPSPEVLKMDNYSILMRDCKDFRVQCAYTNGRSHADEYCINFKMMDHVGSSEGHFKWITAAVICFLCCGVFCVCWKRKRRRQQRAATTSGFLPHQLTSWPDSRDDGSQNGGDENDNVQETTVKRVCSDDISAPNISSASHHGTTNRNLKDDPGGMNDTQINDAVSNDSIVSDVDVSRAACDQKTGEPETRRQPLQSDQRAANRGIDVTGEATPLVDKDSFYPDRDNGSSAVPVHGVESEFKENL